jgi:hypothetical protein
MLKLLHAECGGWYVGQNNHMVSGQLVSALRPVCHRAAVWGLDAYLHMIATQGAVELTMRIEDRPVPKSGIPATDERLQRTVPSSRGCDFDIFSEINILEPVN